VHCFVDDVVNGFLVSIVLQFGCFNQMLLGVSQPKLHIRGKISAKIVHLILYVASDTRMFKPLSSNIIALLHECF